MPLYEYECQSCGNRLEAQQRMADAALVTCPKCGKEQLQRLISATAFHLKGGGWYKDLYSSSKPGSESGSSEGVPTSTPAPSSTPSPSDASPAPASSPAPAPSPSPSGGGDGST